jgi:methionyl-tRNA synthetase
MRISNPPIPPLEKGGKGGFEMLFSGQMLCLVSYARWRKMITIEDFAKVELKIGKVLEAKRVEGSNKLIVMKVDTGEERQIVAGIGKAYSPEELVGKSIVVVTNLQPAKLMGVESQGMLLAASDDDGRLSILTTDREIREGSKVK